MLENKDGMVRPTRDVISVLATQEWGDLDCCADLFDVVIVLGLLIFFF